MVLCGRCTCHKANDTELLQKHPLHESIVFTRSFLGFLQHPGEGIDTVFGFMFCGYAWLLVYGRTSRVSRLRFLPVR